MRSDLSLYSDDELETEIARRRKIEQEKIKSSIIHQIFTPTDAEIEAANKQGWSFYLYAGNLFVSKNDTRAFTIIDHPRWQSWLSEHRRAQNSKLQFLRG